MMHRSPGLGYDVNVAFDVGQSRSRRWCGLRRSLEGAFDLKTCSICAGPLANDHENEEFGDAWRGHIAWPINEGRCCTECDYQKWRGRDWVRSHLLVLGLNQLIHAPSRQRDCASADSAAIWRSAAATTKRPQEPHDNIIRPELVACILNVVKVHRPEVDYLVVPQPFQDGRRREIDRANSISAN